MKSRKKIIRAICLGTCLTTCIFMVGTDEQSSKQLSIFYRPEYNFPAIFQMFHYFDLAKYRKVAAGVSDFLLKNPTYKVELKTDTPAVTRERLLTVHTPEYLDSLCNNRKILTIAGISLPKGMPMMKNAKNLYGLGKYKWSFLSAFMGVLYGTLRFIATYSPSCILDYTILRPMRYATEGTIAAVETALKTNGCAINIGGGYHHAATQKGDGFCYYADINIAVKKAWETRPNLKVMVVDLDAHQGNGHERIFGKDQRVTIFDVYNKNNYPHDDYAKQFIKYNYPIEAYTGGSEYLKIIKKNLPYALKKERPGLVIYNAGTDPLAGDNIGRLNVSKEDMVERDKLVFNTVKAEGIPVVMLTSGGYTQESASIITKSLTENVIPLYGQDANKTQDPKNSACEQS